MTGLAGELFVAAELLKRRLQASITFGNAKQIDILVHNPRTDKNFAVQVKSLRSKNYFPIKESQIKCLSIYVFVLLNEPGKAPDYFIVPGQQLLDEPERYDYRNTKFPCIYWRSLMGFKDNWNAFERTPPIVNVGESQGSE